MLRVWDNTSPFQEDNFDRFKVGEVAERLKAAVLKTVNPQGFQSSNLCLSVTFSR